MLNNKQKEPEYLTIIQFSEVTEQGATIQTQLFGFHKKPEAVAKAREVQSGGLRIENTLSGDIFFIPRDQVLKIIVRDVEKFNQFMIEQERKIIRPNSGLVKPEQFITKSR